LDLKEWLKQQAELNHRSLNGEMVARLESSRFEEAQGEKLGRRKFRG
jgi:hypothetical protein